MTTSSDWLDWPILSWTELDHQCGACQQGGAQIQFAFRSPAGPVNRAWHYNCLPPKLRDFKTIFPLEAGK